MNRPKHGEPWSAREPHADPACLTYQAYVVSRPVRVRAEDKTSEGEPRGGKDHSAPAAAYRHRSIIVSLTVGDPFTATG